MSTPSSFSEVPEPDRMEQSRDLESAEEVVGEGAPVPESVTAVREADPGDLAEQSLEVGLDDEDHPPA